MHPAYETTPLEQKIASAVSAVSSRGGVARVRTMTDAGTGRYAIRAALAANALVRVRRDWVALPTADPYLHAAARAGVVVTCVTQARRLGLWVLDEDRAHVAADPHRRSGAVDATVHWAASPPSDARASSSNTGYGQWAAPLIPRHPDALVDPIENVLAIVASCQPYERALAVWESALRSGQVVRAAMERLDLSSRAQRLLRDACPFSDSGLETFVVPRLLWLRLPIVPQAWIAGHRVDFLIGDRLVLQIDGGHHVGAQRAEDIEHDAQLVLLGYHVIRVGYVQVVDRWHVVQDLIARAVAQGLHLEVSRV